MLLDSDPRLQASAAQLPVAASTVGGESFEARPFCSWLGPSPRMRMQFVEFTTACEAAARLGLHSMPG